MKQHSVYHYFIFLLVLVTTACSEGFNSKTQTKLSGKFSNHNGEMVYLKEIQLNGLVSIDSARISDKGSFSMVFNNNYGSGFYVFSTQNQSDAIQLMLSAGDDVLIEADISNLKQSYVVSNSSASLLLKQFNGLIDASLNKADSIYFAYRNAVTTEENAKMLRFSTDSLLRQNQVQHYQMVRNFVHQNNQSLVSILALYSRYGEKTVLDLEIDFDLFSEVATALKKSFPNNFHVIELQKQVQLILDKKNAQTSREQALAIGNTFPDFTLLDHNNQAFNFSSTKGKKVLVYFWKASQAECWDINKQLLALYKKYTKKNNFEIVAISLDTERMQWVTAINIDKLNWINVLADQSSKEIFNTKVLPRMFFIDENGKILAKDLTVNEIEPLIIK